MVAYTPLCRSAIMTGGVLEAAHKKFLSEYQSTVSSMDLDEDQLQDEIERAEQLLQQIDHLISTAKSPRPYLERRGMNAYESIQKKKEKLEKFHAYDALSGSFFSEYQASQQEFDAGVSQVEGCKAWNASTGTFDIQKLDMNWATSINDRWNERQKKIDAKVKAYNLANQEITTKFDEYGNVIGVYVDGKFDAELTNTLQEAIRTQNFNMIKGFGSGFIDQLANNNGKTLLNEWFGERTFGGDLVGTQSYAVGQFVADLASLVQGGAEFVCGSIWMIGGTFGGVMGTPVTGGASAAGIPAINAGGLVVTGHGTGVIASAWGSLGDGYNFDSPDYNELSENNTPNELISKLKKEGWVSEVQPGGGKSGPATILSNPVTGEQIRINANPSNGKPYFRVQNKGGNYLGADGKFPTNASRQELRDLTHFYFK